MDNKVFNFNGNEVSVIINEQGEPLFIAKDVCRILEVKNSRDALSRLDEDEKGVVLTDTLGGKQEVAYINESGLYSLILSSRKPEAKPFKKWVTSEVLPSIRRHGMYATDHTLDKLIENPDLVISLATQLKEAKKQRQALAEQNNLLKTTIHIQSPKVEYYDEVLQSESDITTTIIAKELGMSARLLNQRLRGMQVQFKQGETWVLYAKYQNKGYTKTKTHTYIDSNGTMKTSILTTWTEKGREFIHNLFR